MADLMRWDALSDEGRALFVAGIGLSDDTGLEILGEIAKSDQLIGRKRDADQLAGALIRCFEQEYGLSGKDAGAKADFMARFDNDFIHVGPSYRLRIDTIGAESMGGHAHG